MGRIDKDRWFDGLWLTACLAASSVWCISAGRQLSATFDEPLYLERGLEVWRTGSHAGLMKLGTMPLAIDGCTLPLYLYERWSATPIDPVRDLNRILPWSRSAALVFWWLLLVYGWLAGRSLAGPWGGRLAVAWLACEPNLLAHAALATTDIAVSACLLALVYHFRAGRERSWWPRVGLPGLWFGAALLAKASGMVFGPLCLIAVEAHRMWNTRPWPDYPSAHTNPKRKRGGTADLPRLRFGFVLRQSLRGFVGPGIIRAWLLRASIRDLSQIAAIGFAVTLIYCGCDWRPEPSFVAWAHGLPEGRAHDALVWLSEHLCLFSNAGEGLVRQVKHNMRGHHGSYLLGRAYPQPVWYYFPVALAVKLSLPLLAAPLAVLAARRRAALNWALAVTGALFLFSLNCRVQIGIRLVLPLVVFLVVAVAGGCVGIITQSRPWPRRLWIAGSLAAVLWTSAAAWRAWPEGLCYTNELWGGSDNGYLCLSDSNYDWGQGVKELAAWTRGRGWPQLDVWYFGSDPAVNAAPLRHLPLHLLPIGKPSDVPTFVQSRYLAVGTTLIYGTPLGLPAHRAAVDFLRSRTPVARTATFLIYDLAERVAASPDYSWPHEFQRRLRAHQPEAQAR